MADAIDTARLVERLRLDSRFPGRNLSIEAADALDAQAARIKELAEDVVRRDDTIAEKNEKIALQAEQIADMQESALEDAEARLQHSTAQAARIAALEAALRALRALRGLVIEGGVPRYTVTPGAALNAIIEEQVDPLLRKLEADHG